jgi:hypothetical protein
MGDSATVLDPVAKREQVLFGPLLAGIEIRLFGHAIHPNSRGLKLTLQQKGRRSKAMPKGFVMLIRFIAKHDDGSKEPFDIYDTDLRSGDHVARIIAGERQCASPSVLPN